VSAEPVTLVTGAASGIGAAVVELLLAEGRRVCGWDVQRPARETAARFELVNVTDEGAVRRAIAETERSLGPVDELVNAAGVLSRAELCSPDTTLEELRRVFAVNVEGVWLVSRAVAERMMGRRRGAIVTVASNAASVPRLGLGAYCASKAAAAMLTRCLGLELAKHGVRCNVVSPGSTDTPMLSAMLQGAGHDALIGGSAETFRLGIPLGRVAHARDVADAVLFLLSDRARHITLHDLRVDGGATL
jgi:2,3-dihydro-2,3-dihydroxybenzoate dehydrogenase